MSFDTTDHVSYHGIEFGYNVNREMISCYRDGYDGSYSDVDWS